MLCFLIYVIHCLIVCWLLPQLEIIFSVEETVTLTVSS